MYTQEGVLYSPQYAKISQPNYEKQQSLAMEELGWRL